MSSVVAGVIGSCRVHVTLGHAEKAGLITCSPKPPLGYVHNPYEVIQGIEALKGRRQLRADLHDYLTLNHLKPFGKRDLFKHFYSEVDVFVVELSSIRVIEYEGWHLQINCAREQMTAMGVPKAAQSKMYSETDTWRSALAEVPSEHGVEGRIKPLIGARLWEMGPEEVATALRRIVAALGRPVVFVGIFTSDAHGREIDQRIVLRDQMIALSESRADVGFINPTDFVDQHGFETTLKDLGHYKPEFEPTAGALLAERVCAFHQTLV